MTGATAAWRVPGVRVDGAQQGGAEGGQCVQKAKNGWGFLISMAIHGLSYDSFLLACVHLHGVSVALSWTEFGGGLLVAEKSVA